MSESCALFAVLDDGERVQVGRPSTDWHLIQRRFSRYGDSRYYGSRAHTVGGKIVRHFVVRSTDDPAWNTARAIRCADLRLIPDRPHRVVISGGYGRFRAFVVTADGIANSTGYVQSKEHVRRDHPDTFKAVAVARRNARRAGLI